jgi:tetratricopeptide (TPR) repeat protein
VIGSLLPMACAGKSKADRLQDEGTLLYKHRKYYKAIEKFEEALKLEPERARTLTMLADAYLKTNKPETAVQFANKALTKQPDLDEANLILGQSYLAMANMQTTRTAGREREADPRLLGQAAEIASKLRKKNPNSMEGMLLQAEVDVQNQRPQLAEQLYKAVLKDHPKESRASIGLARVLMMQRKLDEAETLLRKVVNEEKPPNPQAVWHLASALMLEKKYNDAWEVLKPSMAADNKDPDLTHYLLAGQVLLSELQSARDGLITTATTAAEHGTTGTTQTTTRLSKDGLKEAIDRLAALGSQMKGTWPGRPESWYFRGLSYQFQGNSDEAVRHFQEAIRRDARNRDYRMSLAGAHIQQKQFELARTDLRNILKEFPDDYDARLRIAQTYAFEGNAKEAISTLRGLLIERPDNKAVKQMLGQMLAAGGDPAQVQEGLKLLEELSGENGLAPGGRDFVLGQAAIREARLKAATGDYQGSTLKYQEAEQRLSSVLLVQPTNYQAAIRLAELAEMRGDLVTALNRANRAAQLNPHYRANEARLYARLGQTAVALEKYAPLVAESPNDVMLNLEYAALLTRSAKYQEALALYEKLIQANPLDGRAYEAKAQLLTSMQGVETAIKFLRETVAKQPTLDQPATTLAHLLLQQGQPAEVEQLLAQVTQSLDAQLSQAKGKGEDKRVDDLRNDLAPRYLELAIVKLLLDKPDEAQKIARDARRVMDKARVESTLIEAIANLYSGKPEPAITLINSLENKDGKLTSFIPVIKSLALIMGGKMDEAQAILKDQPDLNEDALTVYRGMLKRQKPEAIAKLAPAMALQIYLGQRPLFAAANLEQAQKAIKSMPGEPFLLSRQAESQQMLGRGKQALETYEALAKALPQYVPVRIAQMDLKMILAEAAQSRKDQPLTDKTLKEAEALGRAALELAPSNALVKDKLAGVLQRMGKTDDANALYRQIIKEDPKNAAAHNNLAWNLAEAGKLDEAAVVAEAAVQAAPASGGVVDTLGWIEFRLGKFAKAAELLGRASRLEPTNPDIRFHLAQALDKAGQTRAASATLETMLLAWPRYEKAGEIRTMLMRLEPNSPALKPHSNSAATTVTAETTPKKP